MLILAKEVPFFRPTTLDSYQFNTGNENSKPASIVYSSSVLVGARQVPYLVELEDVSGCLKFEHSRKTAVFYCQALFEGFKKNQFSMMKESW